MLNLLLIALLSYLLGSIPTSIILSRLMRGIDIREHGSKNAGATNVFRVLGPIPGVIVLLLDAAKGFLAVTFISNITVGPALQIDPVYLKLLAAVAATLGHIYTLLAGFKGGKGVGTGAGALLGLIPREVGLGILVFVIVLAWKRYVSLGSLCAAVFISLAVTFEKIWLKMDISPVLVLTCWGLTLLVFYTHRYNMRRLLTGTEKRIGEKVQS